MILVMGASGNVGSKIVTHLLSAGQKVRCFARHFPQKEIFSDAELIQGDANNVALLSQAMRGCSAVFTLIPPSPFTNEVRYYQNKFGEVVAEAIEEAGIKKIVNLSSIGADIENGTGPILGLHDQEQRLNQITHADIIHLRPAYFMENFLRLLPDIIFSGKIIDNIHEDVPIPLIATKDIAARAAFLLMNPNFEGHNIENLLGERGISYKEILSILKRAFKKTDFEYTEVSPEEKRKILIAKGINPDWADAYVELSSAMSDGTIIGTIQRNKLNTTATSFESFTNDVLYPAYRQAVRENIQKASKLTPGKELRP